MPVSAAEASAALDQEDDELRHAAIAGLDLLAPAALALLVRAMGDASWRVRREAVDRAVGGAFAPASLAAVLVPVLAEPENVGLRNAAIESVVALGPAAVPLVEQALRGLPEHRKVLCDVLGRIGAPASARALLRALEDRDPNVRIAAAEALGRLAFEDDPEVAEALRIAVTLIARDPLAQVDPANDLYGSAVMAAMARRRVPMSIALLEALLRSRVLGTAALLALGSGAAPTEPAERSSALARVLVELDSTSRVRREATVLAIGSLLTDGEADTSIVLSAVATAGLTEALLEGAIEVQRAAALTLGASGDLAVVRPLLVAIEDPALEPSVEHALALLARRDPHALGGMLPSLAARARAAVYRVLSARVVMPVVGPSREAFVAIVGDLLDEDTALAVAAARALGVLGDAASAEPLARALRLSFVERAALDEPWARIDALQRALETLAARVLVTVLELCRGHAPLAPFMLVLARIGDAGDAAAMLAQLGDPDASARGRAADALGALIARADVAFAMADLERVTAVVRVALADEDADVRAATVGVVIALESRRLEGATQASVDVLLRAAHDSDHKVRGAAARALVTLSASTSGERGASLRAGLRALADAPDPLTAVPVLEGLLRLGDVLDDPRLLDALTSRDAERRKVALTASSARPQLLRNAELARLLESALHDDRWDLRRAAIDALTATGAVGRAALVGRRSIEVDPMVLLHLDRALALLPADDGAGDAESARRGSTDG